MKKSNVFIKTAALLIAAICCGTAASAESVNNDIITDGYIIAPFNVAINLNQCQLSMPSPGIMNCFAKTNTISGYSAETIVELQQLTSKWETIKKWTNKKSLSAIVDENYTVEAGYSYRLNVTHKAYNSSGKLVESFERYSNIIAYK